MHVWRSTEPQTGSSQPIVGGSAPSGGAGSRTDILAVVKSPVFVLHSLEWIFSIVVMATASSTVAYALTRGLPACCCAHTLTPRGTRGAHRRLVSGSGFAIFVAAFAFLAATTFLTLLFLGRRVRATLARASNAAWPTLTAWLWRALRWHGMGTALQVGALVDYQQLATFVFGALWTLLYFIAGIVMAAGSTWGPVPCARSRARPLTRLTRPLRPPPSARAPTHLGFKSTESNTAAAFSFLSVPLWGVTAFYGFRANTIPLPFISKFTNRGASSVPQQTVSV